MKGLIPVTLLVALLAPGCVEPQDSPRAATDPAITEAVDTADVGVDEPADQVVYVPTYSHIYIQDGDRDFDLTATLSVRNTDPENPITIRRIRYFNSEGQVVRSYLTKPRILGPLSSMAVVIEERDRTGGVGANFLVAWGSDLEVSQPVIEAVMISTASSQGISFVSRGVVVRPLP